MIYDRINITSAFFLRFFIFPRFCGLIHILILSLLAVTEDGLHILEDGNFFYEIAGLPPEPEDFDSPIPSYQTKVKFSTHPMQVRMRFHDIFKSALSSCAQAVVGSIVWCPGSSRLYIVWCPGSNRFYRLMPRQ